jgi:nucleoside-diphosphate-sugar epimerase
MEINIITGGTGFLGKYLVKRLLDSDKRVWLLIRSKNRSSPTERAVSIFGKDFVKKYRNLRIVESDITKTDLSIKGDLLKEMTGKKVIFWHLAANLSFSVRDKEKIIETNQIGTRNVLDLVNRIACKYIHVSTAYVCGDTKKVFAEDDLDVGQRFRNYYESSKFLAEKHVRASCKVPYTIFRPSIIIGDAYEGKAQGCTFGYYRFAYIFFIFKKWILDLLDNGSSWTKYLLINIGTKYNEKDNTLSVPWLILPFTSGGTVDLVPVDYVIESMIRHGLDNSLENKTFHLTNPHPPAFKFVLSVLMKDLGYRHVKYIRVSPPLLKFLIKLIHFIMPPLRTKLRSALWYLPYISRRYYFSHNNTPPVSDRELFITESFLTRVNNYAVKEIFNRIDID